MLRIWGLILVTLLFSLTTAPAFAGFRVCNSTEISQSVSIGYRSDDTWTSEGWWTIDVGECKLLRSGDLDVRYFYYRATAKGGTFAGERYMFCTDTNAYTIVGDEDCESRGYKSESFSEIEIGNGVTEYELTLVNEGATSPAVKVPSAPLPTPTPQPQPIPVPQPTPQPPAQNSNTQSGQSGALGEPFSVSGVFQGCEAGGGNDGGAAYCAFHAEGWKWYLYEDGGTSGAIMNQIKSLQTGDLADFSGDLISFADVSVDAVARSVAPHGPRDENENMMAGLQGKWRNTQDAASIMIIHGGESFEYYGSELMDVTFLQFADSCEGSHGAEPVLIKQSPGDPDPYCYVVLGWDAVSLQLSYVGGAGANDTNFERFH